ncbi:MAG: SufD family Fe-S cluster assembly protein, partial [Planctomycetota bacterium]
LGSRLEGPGARAELYGFLFGDGRHSFDHHTVHHHRGRHTSSDLDFKVVLCDRARSAYTGLIRIEPEAPVSEAYQENRNLVLGDEAKATSIPELEILTDDVRCTHGATVGSLDPNEVFYLRSRGLDRAEATRLIVEGFIEPAASRLPEAVRRRVLGDVERKMRRL